MTEIEITDIPPLRPDEQSLLAMHSLLNVFNVLRGEMVMIGLTLAGEDELLVHGLALCDEWIANLRILWRAWQMRGGWRSMPGPFLRKLTRRSPRIQR